MAINRKDAIPRAQRIHACLLSKAVYGLGSAWGMALGEIADARRKPRSSVSRWAPAMDLLELRVLPQAPRPRASRGHVPVMGMLKAPVAA